MSKYIIDLPDNCSWVQWVMTSDKDGHAYFDFKSPEDLTTLDKALSSELGEAYQKGLEEGKKQAKVQAHLDVCHDIERVAHGNYQKGLDDAWETIIKIALIPYAERSEIFDGQQDILSIMQKFSPSEVTAKLREYEQQKSDAEIKVGDEVEDKTGEKLVIAHIDPSTKSVCVIGGDGCAYGLFADDYKKTGKHYSQVEELLKAMKGKQRDCHTCKHQVASSIECVDCRGFGKWEPKEGAE